MPRTSRLLSRMHQCPLGPGCHSRMPAPEGPWASHWSPAQAAVCIAGGEQTLQLRRYPGRSGLAESGSSVEGDGRQDQHWALEYEAVQTNIGTYPQLGDQPGGHVGHLVVARIPQWTAQRVSPHRPTHSGQRAPVTQPSTLRAREPSMVAVDLTSGGQGTT